MRLLFVIDSLVAGGAQRQMTSLAVEMTRRGHHVDLFVYHDVDHFGEELRAAGIRVLLHRKPSRFSTHTVRALRRLFRDGGYDLVLSYLPVPNLYCLLAGMGLAKRPKLVVSERSFPRSGKLGLKHRLIERLYPWADHITTNSHHMREHFLRTYRWNEQRLSTIWNGLDLERFSATPLARQPGEPLRLLCIGRVERYKGWHLLVEAAAKLREEEGFETHVSLVGRSHALAAGEFAYRGELDELIRRCRLDDAWQFLGERGDIPALFATHHALVHPSSVEGLSNVVCESLACGRPVVVADAFDHRRLVQHGETGWLFEPGSANSLADALRSLHRLSQEQLLAIGASARRFAELHLTVARLADEHEALFHRLIGSSPAARDTVKLATTNDGVAESAQQASRG